MDDETMPTTPPAGDAGQPPVGAPEASETTGPEPKTFDAAYVQSLRNEAAKHRREAAATAAKLKEIEDANLSETEKTRKRAEEAEARAAKAERDLLRTRVALKHQLPDALADRLIGDDEAAMEADAKVLAKLVAPAAASGSPANGARGASAAQLTREDVRKMTPQQITAAKDKGMLNHLLGITPR